MNNDPRSKMLDRYLRTVEELNRLMYCGRLNEWHGMDLTISHINTLVLLNQIGPMRMGVISYYLKNTLSATTSIINRLASKKLVIRSTDSEDRRVVVCELTDQGRQVTERFWRVVREAALQVASKWDLKQFEYVVTALELVLQTHKEIAQSNRLAMTSK